MKNTRHIGCFGFLIFLPMLLLGSGVSAGAPAQEKAEESRSFVLENGLKVYLYKKPVSHLVNCVFAVNLGSKDEDDNTNGLVHILEHYILFRGSQESEGEGRALAMRQHGAFFNAHTGLDLSMFEITAPKIHAEFTLRSLKEILFDLEFSQEALEAEKQVILEELNQLQDDPFRLSLSLVYQNLFPGHPYQRPIYGNRENIAAATAEELSRFYRSYLAPANSSLAVVGDISLPEMEERVKEIFGVLQNQGFEPAEFEKVQPLPKTVEIDHEMDVQMAYLALGLTAPDFNNRDQYALDVLTEIFGRGINPMLYQPLREKRIPVSSLRMGYSGHRLGGAITIVMAMEPKHLRRAKREITRFLKQSRRLEYSSQDYFGDAQFLAMDYMESAKNRLRFLGEQAMERGLAIATSLARFLLLNEIPDRGDYLQHIAEIDTTDLRAAAGEYLAQKSLVVVSILPRKDK